MSAPVIPPGSTIGVVGGGQLGRMLARAAQRTGYRVVVLTGGGEGTPAGQVADIEIAAGFDDELSLARFVDEVDVVTWEFENVDVEWARGLPGIGVPVRPSVEVMAVGQDRIRERQALTDLGVPVAPWQAATSSDELARAVEAVGPPVIAKTARWGYDGNGQVRIEDAAEVERAWQDLGAQRLVVEAVVPFERELSVIVARGLDGRVVDHGVMENRHVDHVLDATIVPAAVPPPVAAEARRIATRLAGGLDVVGVLCVELFVTGAELLVNEIAPRPHNSGHCTLDAAPASQFEQQLRAITGLPLGDGRCRPAAMVQLLGDLWAAGEPDWSAALADPGVCLHLYGKREPRPGRKMGHLTCVASPPSAALERADAARQRVAGR